MRECPVCGDDNYAELAGHFYCTTCNTQSQDVRVEVVDTDAMDGWTGHTDVIREKKTPAKKKKKTESSKGQPWSIYEAYQIVLLNQVEALIQMGARPELKDLVFKLWVNYLAHLGVAFSDRGPVEHLKKYERQRELFPGTTKNPKIKDILGRSKRRRTLGISMKQAEKEMERELVAEALRGEHFEEGDNPLEDRGAGKSDNENSDGDEDDDSDELDEDYLDIADNVIELELLDNNKRRAMHSMSIYKMQMKYTLAICYLGLMVTNPTTTIVDIIRWVKQERLPYLDVSHLISENMKFCNNDWKLFGEGKVPTLARLRWSVNKMGSTLKISPQAAMNFPFSQLVHKYILQLNLPAEFHRCIEVLVAHLNPRRPRHFRLKWWEGQAAAVIIVAIKLVLGVNDYSERIFSKFSKELNTLVYGGKQQLFVWDKWIVHLAEKIDLIDKPLKQGELALEADITERLGRRANATKYTKSAIKKYNKTTQDAIEKPFIELTATWQNKASLARGSNSAGSNTEGTTGLSTNGEVDYDLAESTLLDEHDPVGCLLERSEEVEQSNTSDKESRYVAQWKKVVQRGEVFQRSSIEHLLTPYKFLKEAQILDKDIDSEKLSARHTLDLSGSKIETDVYDMDTSNTESQAEDTPFSSKEGAKKKRKTSEKYCVVIEQSVKTKKHYLITGNSGEKTQIPASFSWLLQLMAKFIYCTPSQLQNEVNSIEHQLCV